MALIEYEKLAGASRERTRLPTTLPTIEENNASGEVAALYEHFRSHFGRPDVPGILKCFATHPPLLRHMMELSESLIFADGALSRCQKEMIATLISVENDCAYCADSHAYFLRVHGGSSEALRAIEKSDLQSPALALAEQSLLTFAQKVNRNSHEIDKSDVAAVSKAGWSELQIAEAAHVAALFAAFNRVANAFGLQSQGLLALYAGDASLPPAQPNLSASTPVDTSEKATI
jgi:uncharacterized peroxidase-related enzyme